MTRNGKLHILHVVHDAPLCGSGEVAQARRIGTMRELTWGPNTCAQCLQLAYLGILMEEPESSAGGS